MYFCCAVTWVAPSSCELGLERLQDFVGEGGQGSSTFLLAIRIYSIHLTNPGTGQSFKVPPVISGTGKATNFKFCTHIIS